MNIIKTSSGLSVLFESIEEFDTEKPWMIANGATYDEFINHPHPPHAGFDAGVKTGKEGMERIRRGWPEMLDKLMKMWGNEKPEIALAESMVKLRRRKRHRSDYGDTLDIHRVWNGELDKAWERPVREHRLQATQRHATIYIDVATTSGTEPERVLWRATAALLICDMLLKTGRAVEIYVGGSGSRAYENGINWVWTAMRIKSYTQPLHMERLAACVTATFFRSYGFGMIMAPPYSAHRYMTHIESEGLPVQLIKRSEHGELVVRIGGHCTSRAAAEAEFMKVRASLAKEHEEVVV